MRAIAPESLYPSFEVIPKAVIVVGADGTIVHSNAQAEGLFGYQPGELTGISLASLIVEGLGELSAADPARPLGTGREVRALKSNGEEISAEVAISQAERGAWALTVIPGITPTERRMRLAVSHSADVLQFVNVEEDLLIHYSDVDGLMGYDPGGFPRTLSGWFDLIHPDDVDGVRAEVERVVEAGQPAWCFRYRIRARDGSYRHWLDRGTVTGFVDGRSNEGVGAIIDETADVNTREQLKAALARSEALLRELNEVKTRLDEEGRYLREEIKSTHNFEEIVGNSAPMMAALGKVEQVAATDVSVLLLGETGSGKELFARAIHAHSPRKDRPLIKVDCTTFPPGLVESDLFGHVKGAFTGADASRTGRFELADGGTIFLDEIGDLPAELQSKLLRVLQEGEFSRVGATRVQRVDVRVIAATNRDLKAEMEAGRFRSDLYYRLCVFPIEIPPLRDRQDDIPLLASFFLTRQGKKLGKTIERISEDMMDTLMAYEWPGNVRELQNVVDRASILSTGPALTLAEPLGNAQLPSHDAGVSLRHDLRTIERRRILKALATSGWKIKGNGNAASCLGLKPSTLRTRMKVLGIERPH